MQAARRGSTPEPPTPPPSVELALRHGLAKRPSGHLRASSGLAFGNLGTGIVLYFQALESFAWLLLLMLVRLTPQPGSSPARLEKRTLRWDETVGGGGAATESKHRL